MSHSNKKFPCSINAFRAPRCLASFMRLTHISIVSQAPSSSPRRGKLRRLKYIIQLILILEKNLSKNLPVNTNAGSDAARRSTAASKHIRSPGWLVADFAASHNPMLPCTSRARRPKHSNPGTRLGFLQSPASVTWRTVAVHVRAKRYAHADRRRGSTSRQKPAKSRNRPPSGHSRDRVRA